MVGNLSEGDQQVGEEFEWGPACGGRKFKWGPAGGGKFE